MGADAASGVQFDAQPLAPGPMAARRWRPVGIPALAERHAHEALAFALPQHRNGSAVSGAIQVVSDRSGRSFPHGLSLCGAQCVACELGGASGSMALVEPVAS